MTAIRPDRSSVEEFLDGRCSGVHRRRPRGHRAALAVKSVRIIEGIKEVLA